MTTTSRTPAAAGASRPSRPARTPSRPSSRASRRPAGRTSASASARRLAVDLVLPLASVAAEAVVTAEAPLVSVVSNTRLDELRRGLHREAGGPAQLLPGHHDGPGRQRRSPGSSGSAILAYGGTSESQNAFTLDGVNVADSGSGAALGPPEHPVDGGDPGRPASARTPSTAATPAASSTASRSRAGTSSRGLSRSTTSPTRSRRTTRRTPRTRRSSSRTTPSASADPLVKDKLWFFGERRVLAPGHDARRRHRHLRPEDPPLPREADATRRTRRTASSGWSSTTT